MLDFYSDTVLRAIELMLGRRNTVRLGRRLLNDARLDVANDIASNGERDVQRAVLSNRRLGQPVTVFDVGAHYGEWSTSLLAVAWEEEAPVTLHVFEPTGHSFERLASNIEPLSAGVHLNNCAMSDVPGRALIYKPHEGAGSSSLHPALETQPEGACEEVTCSTIDIYCRENAVQSIDLLKCDAEGHDLKVLVGAEQMLRARNVTVVQFEYNALWVNARVFLRDAFALLVPMGYGIGKVTPVGVEFYPSWHRELETFVEGNYIAVLESAIGWFETVRWWNA